MKLNFDICTLQSPILIPEQIQLSKYITFESGKMNLITDLICNFPSSIININWRWLCLSLTFIYAYTWVVSIIIDGFNNYYFFAKFSLNWLKLDDNYLIFEKIVFNLLIFISVSRFFHSVQFSLKGHGHKPELNSLLQVVQNHLLITSHCNKNSIQPTYITRDLSIYLLLVLKISKLR